MTPNAMMFYKGFCHVIVEVGMSVNLETFHGLFTSSAGNYVLFLLS